MRVTRFNPPPGWPAPPPRWSPPEGWEPDTSWPAPPDGWELWVKDETLVGTLRRLKVAMTVLASGVVLSAFLPFVTFDVPAQMDADAPSVVHYLNAAFGVILLAVSLVIWSREIGETLIAFMGALSVFGSMAYLALIFLGPLGIESITGFGVTVSFRFTPGLGLASLAAGSVTTAVAAFKAIHL
ncbi:hypothetical protein J5X84_33075 [Streptosporangiaceae bacterium NEAU-GS5]|nr:hypothetical protein [Streptosporangiaceae bacterium NEAU-GS5]